MLSTKIDGDGGGDVQTTNQQGTNAFLDVGFDF
jgi:hypothetical protein